MLNVAINMKFVSLFMLHGVSYGLLGGNELCL